MQSMREAKGGRDRQLRTPTTATWVGQAHPQKSREKNKQFPPKRQWAWIG